MYLVLAVSNVREYIISVVPEMFLVLDCSLYSVEDSYGHLLVLWADDTMGNKGLQGQSVYFLKNQFELFPAILAGVFTLCVDVEGFQEDD